MSSPQDARQRALALRQAAQVILEGPGLGPESKRLASELLDQACAILADAVRRLDERLGNSDRAASKPTARKVKRKQPMSTAHAKVYDRSAAMSAVAKGRRVNPDHPIYAWLDSRGETLTEWAKAKGYSRALVAYWVNGQRRIPVEIAQTLEAESQGAVRVIDWPKRRG